MAIRASALLCDDIRQESSGKFIIVGGYAGNLGAYEFPVDDFFSCLLRVDGLAENTQTLSIRLKHIGHGADEKTYDLSDYDGDHIVMALSGVPIKASRPGDFYVEISFDGGNYRKIERIKIAEASD